MTRLEQRISQAKHRLWVNRWFHAASWSVTLAASLCAVVILIQRLFEWPLPLTGIGSGLAIAALMGSLIWTAATRETDSAAAVRLDEAAGLRERLSSGLYCRGDDDPFARAVLGDAERTSASLAPRSHIQIRWPRSGWLSGVSVAVAALMFLIEPGLLRGAEAEEAAVKEELAQQTKVAVAKRLAAVKEMAEKNPALKDLHPDLKDLDTAVTDPPKEPAGIRHEAVKKIDRLADAVRNQRKNSKYGSTREFRKMMRGLKTSDTSRALTQKLAKALQRGDLKEARKEIQALKEMLATLKFDEDKELVQQMNKQLADLAKQLEELSKRDKLKEKLVQSGLKKEEAERLLQNLRKEDLKRIQKSLKDRGLSQEQIKKLLQKLAQNKLAQEAAQKLARGMKSAAGAMAAGDSADAVAGLSMAEGQLGDLEMLEQEMNALDGALAELQDARNDLGRPCSACQGTGMRGGRPCGRCGGRGGGQGPGLGQGRGGLASEQETDVAFTKERVKVHSGKGAIIGQMLVEGEQEKGEVTSALARVANAAERAASDRINRDRVPRQYQPAVKAYFATVKEYGVESEEEDADAAPDSIEEEDENH